MQSREQIIDDMATSVLALFGLAVPGKVVDHARMWQDTRLTAHNYLDSLLDQLDPTPYSADDRVNLILNVEVGIRHGQGQEPPTKTKTKKRARAHSNIKK